MSVSMFFYGTLCHAPLLEIVLGRNVDLVPATLSGWAAHWAKGRPHPMLVPSPSGRVSGFVVTKLSPTDQDRLDYYEGGFDFLTREVAVETSSGPQKALAFFTSPGVFEPAAPWDIGVWAARYGDAVTATARDVMRLMGKVPAEDVLARYPMMLVRGDSRVRAARDPSPATLRRYAKPDDVALKSFHQPYAHFFAVEEYDLRFRQFDGEQSAQINRAVFISGDAVTVLPYDPLRDRVLLVEQFRAGPYARGDNNPWSLEAIAGRIDPGETAEDCARREAIEEAGLALGQLLPVAQFYPSPGAKSEYLYNFVALCDLPDGVEGVFGVAEEAEDIKGHLVSFHKLMSLVETGEISNGQLILTVLWLQRERPRLRSGQPR